MQRGFGQSGAVPDKLSGTKGAARQETHKTTTTSLLCAGVKSQSVSLRLVTFWYSDYGKCGVSHYESVHQGGPARLIHSPAKILRGV